MPFPWKKNQNRVTRITRIVADLHSPKRGGSLVVETGFPTSLIDLFVKNRSRFTKSKSKKPVRPYPPPPPPPPSPEATPPPPLPEPPSEDPGPSPFTGEIADGVVVSGRVGECGSGSGANVVVGVVVRVLVVVGLIASVKRITVGITVSAFALVFLEYAAKRTVSRLGPCCYNAIVKVETLAKRVSRCVWFQKLVRLKEEEDCEVGNFQGELRSDSMCIDEIEVVETISESCRFVGPELGFVSGDVKWGCSDLVEDCDSSKPCGEVSECHIRGSRSGRFKSKLVMKLVPKRFRGSKKEKKDNRGAKEAEAESGSEVSSVVEEDKSQRFEIEEVHEDVGKEEDEKRNRSQLLLKGKLVCVRDDEVDCRITGSHESALSREEVDLGIDRLGNSGYTILLVIALAGLLVGRLPALILIMAWCFMLKIFKILWRSQNVPLIKCSVPNS